ncbi:MAG: tRNA (uridine(34)/cytosine(34)/5-carboxymethylaminomethyluridine(34)-2'-O)-methyltransferase TrmL [Pseudomonadota bacterium]|nr:tRNA (uridine(34)/cytosine(34)/5-carboxymethylaminomethyluridine(34)-2'-O)-methyltransferase TrmL [Pseudomonadota bacterium]
MFHVVLYQPEIPPNTGNVIRLCANTGCQLHLIRPLGFAIDHAKMRRAGLDYHEFAKLNVHEDMAGFIEAATPARLFALSTRGRQRYDSIRYAPGDAFVFGPETRGLPQSLLDELPATQCLRLPMQPHNRSLNLSNTVAIVVFEAWRQNDFAGAAATI